MKKRKMIPLLLSCCLLMATYAFAGDFTLTSPQIAEGKALDNEQVFNGFGCNGGNISPELHWSGEPTGTKSFGITVYDPDAPTGSGWWHWVVFNIPASTHSLAENSGSMESKLLPQGSIQSRTDFGTMAYGGACPPAKDSPHRYQFTVWALDVDKIPLDENASAAMVGFFFHQHQLGRAELTATYDR